MLKMGPEFMGTGPREHINMHRLHRWSFFANLEDLIQRVYTSPAQYPADDVNLPRTFPVMVWDGGATHLGRAARRGWLSLK
jgi:hypothetical protein